MYEIVDITDMDEEEYEVILSEDLSENIDRESYRGLAVRDSDDGKVKGIVIWCYSTPYTAGETIVSVKALEYSDIGCANELLSDFFEIVNDEDAARIEIELADPDEELCRLLSEAGFELSKGESTELIVELSDVTKIDYLKNSKGKSKVTSLFEIDIAQYRKAAGDSINYGMRVHSGDITSLPKRWFDEEVSCCAMDGDHVTGMFLVHRTENGFLMPELLYAYGQNAKEQLLEMLRFSANEAAKKYDSDTRIIINRKVANTRKLTDYMFPGKKARTVTIGERIGADHS